MAEIPKWLKLGHLHSLDTTTSIRTKRTSPIFKLFNCLTFTQESATFSKKYADWLIKFWPGEKWSLLGLLKINIQKLRLKVPVKTVHCCFISTHPCNKKTANKCCWPSTLYQQCCVVVFFFLQLFNHYSALQNRWGLYRLESKQKNKCEMGKQPHCEPQTCTPGVNYILMESCMRACIYKHSHHFGGIKYMHMHNKRHEGMRPYVLLGKCMWRPASDSMSISAALHVWCEASSAQLPPFPLWREGWSLNYPPYVAAFFPLCLAGLRKRYIE